LNEESWKTIECDFLRDPLISLLADKSLDINDYYHLVLIFIQQARSNNMELVSVDQICFLLDLVSMACKTHVGQGDTSQEEIKQFKLGLESFKKLHQINPPNRAQLFDDLIFLRSVQKNTSLNNLLLLIQMRLEPSPL
jgi:hypothetical protein